MDEPTVLKVLGPELRRLELLPAAREPLTEERAVLMYPLVAEVREALDRLADALEAESDRLDM